MSTLPTIHTTNLIILVEYDLTHYRGRPYTDKSRDDEIYARIANEVGGYAGSSSWPCVNLKLFDPKGGIANATVSMFRSSRKMCIKGPIHYATCMTVLQRVIAMLADRIGLVLVPTLTTLANIHATTRVRGRINMQTLESDPQIMPNYDPTLIKTASYRSIDGPTFLIWASGSIVTTGTNCTSLSSVREYFADFYKLLKPHIIPPASASSVAPDP